MEVTFLSSAGSFAGVGYNLSKVEKHAAELMEVANFEGLQPSARTTAGEYVRYLKEWNARNTRIKNAQFHVAISCRGREKSKEELLAVAKEWLKEMGYEGNPTLFVFHSDTDNNHIHIVTSRVDKDGKKICDSNERWRGRAALKRIEGISLNKDYYAEAVKEALEYRFANVKQFALILEQQNYKVKTIDNGDVEVRKYGKVVASIPSQEMTAVIEQNTKQEPDTRRIKQVRAWMHKYRADLSLAELKATMKRAFGLDLVFFGRKDKPYGYAIIDHKTKAVYKGGDIVPLKVLMETPEQRRARAEQTYRKGCAILAQTLENRRVLFSRVSAELRRWGYWVKLKDGHLYHYAQDLGRLPDHLKARVQYSKHLEQASAIRTNDPRILYAVAAHFEVLPDDLQLSPPTQYKSNRGYHSLQEVYDEARQEYDFFAFLKLNNAYLFSEGGRTYMCDNTSGAISAIDTSNPERAILVEREPLRGVEADNFLRIDDIANLFRDHEEGSAEDNSLRKRRRR